MKKCSFYFQKCVKVSFFFLSFLELLFFGSLSSEEAEESSTSSFFFFCSFSFLFGDSSRFFAFLLFLAFFFSVFFFFSFLEGSSLEEESNSIRVPWNSVIAPLVGSTSPSLSLLSLDLLSEWELSLALLSPPSPFVLFTNEVKPLRCQEMVPLT